MLSEWQEAKDKVGLLTDLADRSYLQAIDLLSQSSEKSHVGAEELIKVWRSWGLCGIDEDEAILYLLPPAQQLVEHDFSSDVLDFLPDCIDDLWARRSLLVGGIALIDSFREDLESMAEPGEMLFISDLLPEAFRPALDRRLALDLFAAATSLMTNLTRGYPASSVAEEVCAVELLNQAEASLQVWEKEGQLNRLERIAAKNELNGIFELFEDDDVLALWEIPSDPEQQEQFRLLADDWFTPFGGVATTGYLRRAPAAKRF